MLCGLSALKERGVTPRAVVDGGAFVGDWTRLLKSVFPDARVLMIEPQTRHAEALRRLSRTFEPTVEFASRLLGPENRESVDFCVLDDPGGGTGSSVMPENSDVPRHTVQLRMTTLDNLVAEKEFPAPDFVKLDVQGFELEVLRGATSTLSSAQFVLLEVSTWRYNTGGPLLHDVVAWMFEAGFVTYDLFGVHRRPDGILLQLDLLFVRSDSGLLAETKTIYGTDVAPEG
jgi:FkbM family methyltransferase